MLHRVALLSSLLSCAANELPSEDELAQAVVLPAPANLRITSLSSVRMDIAWDAVPGATRYLIADGPAPGTTVIRTSWSGTTYANGHLSPGQQRCWRIYAVDPTGDRSLPSDELCATTLTTVPPPVLRLTNLTATRADLAWDPIAGATGYLVRFGPTPETITLATTWAGTTYSNGHLTAGTQACWSVLSQIMGDRSAPSNTICVTPPSTVCNPVPEVCGDNIDQDCDGVADDNCCVPSAEVCGDGIDNDCDTNVDDGCIGNFAWTDSNTNGLQDAGEPGLTNATMLLRTAGGSLVSVQVSNAAGRYYFANIPAGSYYVEVVPPSGRSFTANDVGGNDAIDSDVDQIDGTTSIFTYNGLLFDTLDFGFTP